MASQFVAARSFNTSRPSNGFDVGSMLNLLNGGGKGSDKGQGKGDRPPPLKFFVNQIPDGRLVNVRGRVEMPADEALEVVPIGTSIPGLLKYCLRDRAVCCWLHAGDDPDESWAFAHELEKVLTCNLSAQQRTRILKVIGGEMWSLGVNVDSVHSRLTRRRMVATAPNEAYAADQLRRNLFPDGQDVYLPDGDLRAIVAQLMPLLREQVPAAEAAPRARVEVPVAEVIPRARVAEVAPVEVRATDMPAPAEPPRARAPAVGSHASVLEGVRAVRLTAPPPAPPSDAPPADTAMASTPVTTGTSRSHEGESGNPRERKGRRGEEQ